MIGSTRTEMTGYFLTSNPNAPERDFAAVIAQLEPIFGTDAARIVAHYRSAHPQAGSWEIDALIRSDWPTRLFTQRIADEQSKLGGAPVWAYRMDWKTTARNGLLMSPHAIDIPFVLDTVGSEAGGARSTRRTAGHDAQDEQRLGGVCTQWQPAERTYPGMAPV